MQKEGSNNGVLPFDEGAGSMFCSTSYVGDARSPEWLASGLTEDSATSNINGDDVMFGRHKPRKSNRTVNGGGGGEDITRTRIHTRQNDQEAELDASMPVSCSSNIDVNGKFTSIWDLVATGRIIKVDRSITGLRRGNNNHPSFCTHDNRPRSINQDIFRVNAKYRSVIFLHINPPPLPERQVVCRRGGVCKSAHLGVQEGSPSPQKWYHTSEFP